MCSTNEPKSRGGTGAIVKSGSRVRRARGKPIPSSGEVSRSAEAGGGDPADDLALEQHEYDDQWEARQDGRGHDLGIAHAEAALDLDEADGERHQARVGGDDERPQEVVP